ncbi:MAG: SDR family oxidoreductase [Acidimicrobiales bacterium]|jgi:7-alpha-hydroxysteroid dehydrogenase
MILERFRLDGRVAIVTGAGRGLGAAAALALAEAGADLVMAARTPEDLASVAEAVGALGRSAEVVVADLSDLDAVAGLTSVAGERFGRLDVVVNNVGGWMPRGFLETSPGNLERAFHFNVSTAHALTRAATPLMLEGGGGSVVSISSAMGRLANRGYVSYGTAKAALAHWTRLVARDLAPRIRVNAIAVGMAATSALDVVVTDDAMRARVEAVTPLRRIADPSEIAAVVLFLASPASSFVTGKILEVDGGAEQSILDLGLPDL